MSIIFSSSKYEFVHGKKPRGVGDWAFSLDGDPSPLWVVGVSFSEAKSEAIRRARAAGALRVEVLS